MFVSVANYQSPWESMMHPEMWNAATMMRDNGYEVVYFGRLSWLISILMPYINKQS